MSKSRSEWWAKQRATPAQANTSTEPVQSATAPTDELEPTPGLPIDEAQRPAFNGPDLELGRTEAPAIGGDGPASDPAGSGVADNSLPPEIHAKPVSPRRHAANIRNAQLSTGPRTAAGKKKSAMNAYKQGFYSRHLFPTEAQWAVDGGDYQRLAIGIRNYYRPRNIMAEIWVEKLVTDQIRLARIIREEQLFFASKHPFDGPWMDRIVRNRNSVEKAVYRDIQELERFQENGDVAFGKLGAGLRGDSGKDGGPYPRPAVGPQCGVNTDGEPAFPDGSEDRPDSGDVPWVESEAVIFQGPPDNPLGDATRDIQSLRSIPTANSPDQAKTGEPSRASSKPPDVMARIVYEAIDLPHPHNGSELAPSKIGETKPTLQPSEQAETATATTMAGISCEAVGLPSLYDEPESARERTAKTKPISTIAPPAGFDA